MTHTLELLNEITTQTKSIKLVTANSTVDGLEAVVQDAYDLQKYRLVLTPIKEVA